MKARSIEELVAALNGEGVRYMIAGGLAVVAHGYVRTTKDVDIVLDLERGNALAAADALSEIGLVPAVPVRLEEIADPAQRRRWSMEKNAVVLQLYSTRDPMLRVDIFIDVPFGFDDAYAQRTELEVAPGVTGVFVGLETLLAMKRRAGRPQDIADVAALLAVHRHEE